MTLENVLRIQVCHLFCRDIRSGRNNVRHLHEPIHAYVYRIVSLGGWQLYHEIHRHRLRRALWDGKGIELAMVAAARHLIPCAGVTGSNVLINKLFHPWSGIFPCDQFQCLILSQVAGRFSVMVCFQDP